MALALSLSGCWAAKGGTSVDAAASNLTSSMPSSASPVGEPIGSRASTREAGARAFGVYAPYEDGLAITVSEPRVFTPSPTASAEQAPAYVRFTVTVVNRTAHTFDTKLAFASLRSADREAGAVFDRGSGLEPGPFTRLLRGGAARWDIGFGVQDPKDLRMEITPGGIAHHSVTYTNAR